MKIAAGNCNQIVLTLAQFPPNIRKHRRGNCLKINFNDCRNCACADVASKYLHVRCHLTNFQRAQLFSGRRVFRPFFTWNLIKFSCGAFSVFWWRLLRELKGRWIVKCDACGDDAGKIEERTIWSWAFGWNGGSLDGNRVLLKGFWGNMYKNREQLPMFWHQDEDFRLKISVFWFSWYYILNILKQKCQIILVVGKYLR